MAPKPDMPPLDAEQPSADLIDYRQLRDYLGFVRGAVRRHRLLAVGTFAVTLGLTIALARVLPRTYHVETRILAERNLLMAALCNPGRSIPYDADAPTRAAYETVRGHQSLVSLIRKTHLLERWDATRPPLLKLKDALFRKLTGPLTEEDRLDAMEGTLERLEVSARDGVVTIGLDWPDPRMAYDLVEAAQQTFLETRHAAEVSTISEAISILQTHTAEGKQNVQRALADLQRLLDRKRKTEGRRRRGSPALASRRTNDQELAQLAFLLRARRQSLADLQEFRRRRLNELQAQLTEQRAIYSPTHPMIIDLEQRLAALQREPPELAALEREEAALASEYVRKGGRELDPALVPGAGPDDSALARLASDSPEDPELALALDHLRMVVATHQELLRRLDTARIELDTAEASFKHRYNVLTPASFPKNPVKPKVALLLAAGLLAALALAVFAALARDLASGRILERWQIERGLGLPVLADLNAP